MLDDIISYGKRFDARNHVDAGLLLALFFLSLTLHSLHWLTLPPSEHADTHRLGLNAHDFLQENIFPFYIVHQFAPHPLIVYLQALVIAVFGYSAASLQGVTVVGGALAAPAVYWASRWFFADQGVVFARRAGLIAALGLAFSLIFALQSLVGYEPTLLSLVGVVAVAFLWRGFRHGRRLDFIVAGLFVGLSQYVYIIARFFPVALAVACVGAVLANRQLLAHWRGMIWAAATSALVALPQWILFVTYPYTFLARVSNPHGPPGGKLVWELPNPVATVASKLTNLLLAFCCTWDRNNPILFESLLTPILVVGLVIGVATVIFQRRAGHVFVFLMMVMMLLPDLLTLERMDYLGFDHTRLTPGIPFIFIVAGLGSAAVWAWIESRRRLPRRSGYLVLALVLFFGFLRQWDFATQARPQLLAESSSTSSQIVEYIGNHLDRPILLPTSQFLAPALPFLLAEQFPHRQAGLEETLKQGANVTVILQDPGRAIEDIYSGEWVLLKDRTVHFLPPMPDSIELLNGEETEILGSNGAMVAKAFAARWQGEPPTVIPVEAPFANHLNLVGYQSSDFEPGSPLRVTFYWQPTQKIEREVELFLQIYDRNGDQVVVSKQEWPLRAYRVRAWQADEIMSLSYSLSIPGGLSPGAYQLRVGGVDLLSRKRIPLVTGQDSHDVRTFKVPLPEDNRMPAVSADINFGNVIQLDGHTLVPTTEGMKIILFWRATESPQADYTSFIHIVDSDDQIVAQQDVQPLYGQYPTSIWSPDEAIVDERTISSLSSGEYRVYIGWYLHVEDGWQRLTTVAQGTAPATDRLLLDTIILP